MNVRDKQQYACLTQGFTANLEQEGGTNHRVSEERQLLASRVKSAPVPSLQVSFMSQLSLLSLMATWAPLSMSLPPNGHQGCLANSCGSQ